MVHCAIPMRRDDGFVLVPRVNEDSLRREAEHALANHPHFRGRGKWIRCDCCEGAIRLSGRVPSYYLKQLAQEVVRKVPRVTLVENQIVVTSPYGKVASDADDIPSAHESAAADFTRSSTGVTKKR